MLTWATVEGMELVSPLMILVEWDGNECVVSTGCVDNYGVGQTETGAINDFLQSLALDYRWLSKNRNTLAPRLLGQLRSLQQILRPVVD
jgi:hypothetical protein